MKIIILGGTNSKDNCLLLTAKEHYIAHLLLTKCFAGKDKMKMANAMWRILITNKNETFINSKTYEIYRIQHAKQISELLSGRKKPEGFGEKISRALKDKPKNRESVKKGVETRKKNGSYKTPWNKGKHGLQTSWNKGLTKETSPKLKEIGLKISAANKGKSSKFKGSKRPQMSGGLNPNAIGLYIGEQYYGSLTTASLETGIPLSMIRNYKNGKMPTKGKNAKKLLLLINNT